MAAACRLQSRGFEVHVFEQAEQVGGKLNEIVLGNYRFDRGPSLFTMPHWMDQLFLDCNEEPKDYFQSKPLDIVCKYFWEDGTQMAVPQGSENIVNTLHQSLGEPKKNIRKYLKKSSFIFHHTSHIFLEKSLHKLSTYLNYKALKSILVLPFLGIFKSMNLSHTIFFEKRKAVQYFNRYATYNGSNPYQAPSTLGVIPHIENFFGAHAPKGGMYSIAQSIQNLGQKLGVSFHLGKKITHVEIVNKKAQKIFFEDAHFDLDYLVCNGDINSIYPLFSDWNGKKKKLEEPSSSALIFYWGINKEFKNLDVHNIFFSNDYKKEFDSIFNKKIIGEDPTIYINISSKYATKDAPEGKENWFVMVNAPYDDEQNWETIKMETKKSVLKKLQRVLGENISDLIEQEVVWTPKEIEKHTSSYKGALYGSSSNQRTAAFFRHRNKSKTYQNIYFCGGSVHPGGGIPLCLQSAKITAELLINAK